MTIEVEAAPDAGAEGVVEDQAAVTETQGEDQSFEAPFSLDDVPEEYRPDVERYVKQTQGAFTRKTMELAETRREAEALLALDSRLADESTRQEALEELLGRYDLELDLEDDADEEYERPGELDQFADVPDDELPAWAKELIERDRAREEREREQQERSGTERLTGHVHKALDGFREKAYPDSETLPGDINDALLGLGMILPARSDGLPDMEAAVSLLESIEANAVQRFVDGKRKTPPLPATRRGTSGTENPDLSNEQARLQQANAVAARHLE